MDDLKKKNYNRTPLLCYFKLYHCASFRSHRSIQTGVIVRKRPILGQIWRFFALCHLEIWRITLKNNKAPLLCYFKFCASFFLAVWAIQTVQKWQIQAKNNNFLSCVTLKFDGWPWKTTGHLYFKLCASFHIHRSNWNYSPEKPNSGQNWRFFVPCDLGILAFDREKQKGISSILLQALCTISLPYVNPNWSYSPKRAKLDFDLCDLDLWPWHHFGQWSSHEGMVTHICTGGLGHHWLGQWLVAPVQHQCCLPTDPPPPPKKKKKKKKKIYILRSFSQNIF